MTPSYAGAATDRGNSPLRPGRAEGHDGPMSEHFAQRRGRRVRDALLLGVVGPLVATLSASAADVTVTMFKSDPTISEYAGATNGDLVAWTQNSTGDPDHYNAYIQRPGEHRVRVNTAGSWGYGGVFDGRQYVYTEWRPDGRGEEIFKYDTATGTRRKYVRAVNTRADEYNPTLSGPWLLFNRYDADERKYQVVLFDTGTRTSRILASGGRRRGVFAGQVSGNYATWSRVGDGQEFVYVYDIAAREATRVPADGFDYQYHPSVGIDGTVYYTHSGGWCSAVAEIVRYPLGGPVEVVHQLPSYADTGFSHVYDAPDGSRRVYYNAVDCRRANRRAWDILQIDEPAPTEGAG